MLARTPAALAALLLAATAVQAQSRFTWTQVLPAQRPLPRKDHAMAYDAARGVTVLFGGENGGPYYNDTWTYDGTWHLQSPSTSPLPRSHHSMAYDPLHERVLLIGGWNGQALDDTWEWDGTDWQLVATNVTGIREDGVAAFDPLLGGVLYHAGSDNMVWDGLSWTYLTVANAGGASRNGAVYDAASGGILAVSGRDTNRFRRNAGWENVAHSESFFLSDIAIAVDPRRGRPVFFGGSGNVGSTSSSGFRQTWQWTGAGWTELAFSGPQPRALRDAAMTFDLQRGVFVLFGGDSAGGPNLDETWELRETIQPASYELFGAGCSTGASHQPVLRPDPVLGALPVLGGTFTTRIEDVPGGQPLVGCLGASNELWGGRPLPLELGPLGWSGCSLYVSLDLVVSLGTSSSAGIGRWSVPIPGTTVFVGQRFYQQAAGFDLGATPGVFWTNGGAATIGYQ